VSSTDLGTLNGAQSYQATNRMRSRPQNSSTVATRYLCHCVCAYVHGCGKGGSRGVASGTSEVASRPTLPGSTYTPPNCGHLRGQRWPNGGPLSSKTKAVSQGGFVVVGEAPVARTDASAGRCNSQPRASWPLRSRTFRPRGRRRHIDTLLLKVRLT